MTAFSASDVGLAGFRYARENPKVIGIWAVLFAVSSFFFSWLTIAVAGPSLAAMQAMQTQANPDPQAMLRLFAPFGMLMLVMTPLLLVYYGVVYAAVNRLILRPQDKGFGYLKFGADEFRQIGVLFLIFLAIFAVYMIGIIAIVVVGGILSVISKFLGGFVIFAGFLALLVALAVVSVRISLASASTFRTGRISLRTSWTLTKGHFWPILGAYLLALVMVIIVTMLGFVIFTALALAIGGGFEAAATVFRADMSSVATYFTPVQIIYLLFSAVITALTTLISMSPAALIYRALSEDVAEVF